MTPSLSVTQIAVGVPARNEEDRVAACIASIDEAAGRVELPVHLVVVDDDSDDRTAAQAAAALAAAIHLSGTVVTAACGTAGAARAAAIDHTLEARANRSTTWLATTDADTVVGPAWLLRQLAWAALGIGAVSGLVEVEWEPDSEHLAPGYAASLGPIGVGHPHVHGANLGLHAAHWMEVGGCGEGGDGEDHELWRRLTAAGVRVLGVDDLPVLTSGRLIGRVSAGFSGYLRRLAVAAPAAAPGRRLAVRPGLEPCLTT